MEEEVELSRNSNSWCGREVNFRMSVQKLLMLEAPEFGLARFASATNHESGVPDLNLSLLELRISSTINCVSHEPRHRLWIPSRCREDKPSETRLFGLDFFLKDLLTDQFQIQSDDSDRHNTSPCRHSKSHGDWNEFGALTICELLHWSKMPGLQRWFHAMQNRERGQGRGWMLEGGSKGYEMCAERVSVQITWQSFYYGWNSKSWAAHFGLGAQGSAGADSAAGIQHWKIQFTDTNVPTESRISIRTVSPSSGNTGPV